jgi:hypothetical protein
VRMKEAAKLLAIDIHECADWAGEPISPGDGSRGVETVSRAVPSVSRTARATGQQAIMNNSFSHLVVALDDSHVRLLDVERAVAVPSLRACAAGLFHFASGTTCRAANGKTR